jgi:hypothetical protein
LGDYASIPDGGFKYDASFQGWLSSPTRRDAISSCRAVSSLKFYHKTFGDFYGHLTNEDELKARREGFLRTQQESRILLAPQSIPGVFPYRFYEAMSSARVPALFCTGYHLPFQSEIDWDRCTLRFDAERASEAGALIRSFLDRTSDEQLIEMGKYGRTVWSQWLNRDRQPQLVSNALNRILQNDGNILAKRK